MAKRAFRKAIALLPFVSCVLCLFIAGCKSLPPFDVPTELNKFAPADYTISPPDVILINAANLIPRPPYRIAPLDGLLIRVTVLAPKVDQKPTELLPNQPIDGLYRVEVGGEVNLGFDYGSVPIGGKTIPEAKKAIEEKLKQRFKVEFNVLVALIESRALQQIRGEHLVRQDGKVTLGIYGSVFVWGLTIEEAKHAIETKLSEFLFEPEVAVDVIGYNSKVYYVIFDQGTAGQLINRMPITGNETVLDALSQSSTRLATGSGLAAGSDTHSIWVARRSAPGEPCQILRVDWNAIIRGGSTATNYQLMPGDRVYVGLDPWIRTDQFLAKVISPFERIFGITLLGDSVVQQLALPLGNGANGPGGGR
jgi:polysaccharide biosynthesis/export protein